MIIDKIKDYVAERECCCYERIQNLEDITEQCKLGSFNCSKHIYCYFPNIIKKILKKIYKLRGYHELF